MTARINTKRLAEYAAFLCYLAYTVQRDPAVRKAWSEAGRDTARALKSVAEAGAETRSALRRAQNGDGPDLGSVFA